MGGFRNRRATLVKALCATVAGLGFVTGLAGAQGTTPQRGGSLTFGERPPQVGHLHPYGNRSKNGATDRLLAMIYEPLFRYRYSTSEWENVLATDYRKTQPRRGMRSAFEVTLRSARWHDGTPVTPADVVFTFDYIQKVAVDRTLQRLYQNILGEVRPGTSPNSVIFEFKIELDDPRLHLSQFIIPSARFNRLTYEPVGETLHRRPMGTGPFAFRGWDNNEGVLVRFDGYHTNPAYLDRMAHRYFPDVGTLTASIEGNSIQMIVEVPPEQLAQLEAARDRIYVAPLASLHVYAVALRQRQGSVLNDVRVRRAITMAINRQQLLDNWFGGKGEILASPVTRASVYNDATILALPHNVVEARRLISAAGAAGRELKFHYPSTGGSETRVQDLANSIKGQLEAVGLRVRLVPQTMQDFETTLYQTGDFDLAYVRWEFNEAYDFAPLFRSANSASGRQNMNFLGYSNPVFDRYAEAFEFTGDDAHRINVAKAMQRILHEDAPAVFLVSDIKSYAYTFNFRIPEGSVDQFRFFTYANQWWFRGSSR